MNELSLRFGELAERDVPLPGKGETLARWQFLAEVAAADLALAKLVESHLDAVAILHELGAPELLEAGRRWAVWAAEPPAARLEVDRNGRLSGVKAWCSGADLVGYALVTAWTDDGQPQLVAVDLGQPGIEPDLSAWQAVGMGRVLTPDLHFDAVAGTAIGRPGQYVGRPGFWHGGAGIAACWYGGALPLAQAIRRARPSPHRDAHLGAVDVALRGGRALLRELAADIDRRPSIGCRTPCGSVRPSTRWRGWSSIMPVGPSERVRSVEIGWWPSTLPICPSSSGKPTPSGILPCWPSGWRTGDGPCEHRSGPRRSPDQR